MTRYRLHINGRPTERTCPRQHAYEWAPGWQWLAYEHEPEWAMTGAKRFDGSMVLVGSSPPHSPTQYLSYYKRNIQQPRGMQLLEQQTMGIAA